MQPGGFVTLSLRFGYAALRSMSLIGTVRIRLPVAAKIALRTAGATTEIVGSPTPPQNSPSGMTTVSTFGIAPDASPPRYRNWSARCDRRAPCIRRTAVTRVRPHPHPRLPAPPPPDPPRDPNP